MTERRGRQHVAPPPIIIFHEKFLGANSWEQQSKQTVEVYMILATLQIEEKATGTFPLFQFVCTGSTVWR